MVNKDEYIIKYFTYCLTSFIIVTNKVLFQIIYALIEINGL